MAPASASISVSHPVAPGTFHEPPPKRVKVFIAPSLEPPLISSLSNTPPLSVPSNMPHTQVVSSTTFVVPPVMSPLQHRIFPRVLQPATVNRRLDTPIPFKHKFEDGPIPEFRHCRPAQVCSSSLPLRASLFVASPVSMCVIEKAPPSPEFVTTPHREVSNPILISSPSSVSSASSSKGCMFNSLEGIVALSSIFTRSLTLSSSELADVDLHAASSLTLVAGEASGVALAVVPLQAILPSPYDLSWEDEALL